MTPDQPDRDAPRQDAAAPRSGPRRREGRRTSAQVRVAEGLAQTVITVGGLAVIAAVLGIMAYLGLSVLPLFRGGTHAVAHSGAITDAAGSPAAPPPQPAAPPVFAMVDEYGGLAILGDAAGRARVIDLASGRVVDALALATPGRTVTAAAFERQSGAVAFGYADGSVQLGIVGFAAEPVDAAALPPEARSLSVGDRVASGTGTIERAAPDQYRRVTATAEMRDPTPVAEGSGPVKLLDYRPSSSAEFLVVGREAGGVLSRVRIVRPLGGGKPRVTLESTELPRETTPHAGAKAMFVTGDGASVLKVFEDGAVLRSVVARNAGGDDAVLPADELRALPAGERVTAAAMLLGGKTLMIGTDRGRVLGIFAARDDAAGTPDRQRLVVAHDHAAGDARVTALGISQRDRSYVAATAPGDARMRNMTSGKVIADLPNPGWDAPAAVDVTPKVDGVLLVDANGRYALHRVQPGHPEASAASLFGRVWYEGEAAPSFNYQSSSGEDTAEPKLSLTPLVWGTLKATFYAMIFAVPLAILAAIYTSEMLHPDVRNRVKPIVESMASLPSVVLGFIAALVVAPWARDWLPSILLGFFVVPATVLVAAYLWQTLPVRIASRLRTGQHFLLVAAVTLAGAALAAPAGLLAERALFRPTPSEILVRAGSVEPAPSDAVPAWARGRSRFEPAEVRRLHDSGLFVVSGQIVRPTGALSDPAVAAAVAEKGLDRADMRLWLDGVVGGPWPGWFMVMTLPAAFLAGLAGSRLLTPCIERGLGLRVGPGAALAELAKFLAVCALTLGLSALLAGLLSAAGLDARDSVMGPFNQRNSLVVGIIMGFAIIPIIYTVSEDALSSVGQGLRSASLGAGATRWQTAIRVVLPVAMSGIFSACMIGLGRAAGETMIVLMATGNTPSMDPSLFSGFRTLAANIAVELPEAAKGSTHEKVLYLCGLTLLAMTFLVNTVAEVVRQRFRRRAAGL